MATSDKKFTEAEMLELAGSAIGKIDARGQRGAERVTHDEIIAMALLIHLMAMRLSVTLPQSTSEENAA